MKVFTSLILLLAALSWGYSQQLTNYNFAQYNGNYFNVGNCTCQIYKDQNNVLAVDNWDRSHGTPQVKFLTPSTKPDERVAFMYGYTTSNNQQRGEGIFAGYSFLRNRTYKISMRVLLQQNAGTLYIYGASGVQSATQTSSCQEDLPGAPPLQKLVGTVVKPNSGSGNDINGVFDFYFNPGNIDLTQIWIYPTSPSTTQMDAYVDYVDIDPDCNGNIVYNTGTIPENISKAGQIFVGSSAGSGGSGIVSNVYTASTFLQASNYVMLQPETSLAASGSGSVSLSIIYCQDIISRSLLSRDTIPYDPAYLHQNREGPSLYEMQPPLTTGKAVHIFPSPSSGQITLTGPADDFSNALITVLDQSGREVYQTTQRNATPIVPLNLQHLGNGVYFIRIRQKEKQVIKKIIIQR